jgi:hypothetical protein
MRKFLLVTIIGLSFSIVFFGIPYYILIPLCFAGITLSYLYLDEIIEIELRRKYYKLLDIKWDYDITKEQLDIILKKIRKGEYIKIFRDDKGRFMKPRESRKESRLQN